MAIGIPPQAPVKGATMTPRKQAPFRLALALTLPALSLSGCYVMPVGSDPGGAPVYAYSPLPVVPAHSPASAPQPLAVPGGPAAATLPVKLYPINDLANQTGVLTGEVTN